MGHSLVTHLNQFTIIRTHTPPNATTKMQLLSIAALCLTCASMASAFCITPEMVETIAPKSKECAQDMLPECRTAAEAAPHITRAFHRYGICSPNAMASVMSLMALESGEFQYKRNT